MANKTIDQMVEMTGGLTAEETAEAAGKVMANTNVDREAVGVFLRQLTTSDQDEFRDLNELIDEIQGDDDPEGRDVDDDPEGED